MDDLKFINTKIINIDDIKEEVIPDNIATITVFCNDEIIEYKEIPACDLRKELLGTDEYYPVSEYRILTGNESPHLKIQDLSKISRWDCDVGRSKPPSKIRQGAYCEWEPYYHRKPKPCHFCSDPFPCMRKHQNLTLLFNCHVNGCRFIGTNRFSVLRNHVVEEHRGQYYQKYMCACHRKMYRDGVKENLACKIRMGTYRRK